jgi:alkylation response protein AidB-like acyl-CoA dehydrogenase
MTDGAAKLLEAHLDAQSKDQPDLNQVIREAYRRLTSNDPREAWTAGQWMTERTGGSDVSGTETYAQRLSEAQLAEDSKQGRSLDAHGMPLGPWRIDGFKWFSSATDSDMAMLLAQTDNGLSLFFAPLRRQTGPTADGRTATELNGIRIQRLKDKIGTKSLPTAELELKGVRAYLIGKEGRGVKEISAILNMTRLYTAHGGVGYWARGLQVCRAHSRVRKVRGGLLQENPAHLRWMAGETVKYTAATHFSFLGIAMYGVLEQGPANTVQGTKAEGLLPSDKDTLTTLLRLLTPVMKSQITLAGVAGLREAMECLGGVGYCENNEDGGLMNISKIFRDSLTGPIWEGTVSVMAEDVVRVLTDKRIGGGRTIENVYAPWTRKVLAWCKPRFSQEVRIVTERLEALEMLVKATSREELLFHGRELLQHLNAITCAVLLMFDACTDDDEVSIEIARRWTNDHVSTHKAPHRPTATSWVDVSRMDKKIFLGDDKVVLDSSTAKL